MKRTIHIWELPINKIYINLKNGFREEFFDQAKQKFGTWEKLGNYLDIPRADTTLACNWKSGRQCFPLDPVIKICNKINLSKYELEKNIIEIRYKTKLSGRGGSSGKPIKNPKLPIKINENFIEVLGHICGDGSIMKTINKGIGFKYINSEPALIKSFQELIKNIFGDVEPNIQVRDKKPQYTRPNFYLQYPSIVSLFVLSVFDYKTGNDMQLPPFIFDCSQKEKCKFLRALFDDEGSVLVKDKKIQFVLKPKEPFNDIRRLFISLDIKLSKSHVRKDGVRKFVLASKDSVKKFKQLIGFKHPTKREKLNDILRVGWKFNRYPNSLASSKILLILNRKEATTKEITAELNRHRGTIREHLNNLKRDGLVKNERAIKRVKNYNEIYYIWSLTNYGKKC